MAKDRSDAGPLAVETMGAAMPGATAKRLARVLPAVAKQEQLVPARMVNEVLYCERLMYLEWVQGEFADNYFTVDGRAVHRRADARAKPLGRRRHGSRTEDGDASAHAEENDRPYSARSVWLSSGVLGVTAKIDVVDVDESGSRVVPIEYKRGKPPDVPEGAYLPERAQVCAQALLLREHGYQCGHAEIYFAAARQRTRIELSDELIATTVGAIARAKRLALEDELPPPLVDSPKCNGCSLVGICLPDELSALERGASEERNESEAVEGDRDPWGLAPDPEQGPVRRLHPARDDRVPLLVQEQGARICLDGERIVVKAAKTGVKVEGRLSNTSEVNVFGNVQVTTQALRAVLQRGIPVSFFTYGGWYIGRAAGLDSKNVELRLAQYSAATTPGVCLSVAKGLVVSKVLNCRTLLRRNTEAPSKVVLFELRQLARKAEQVDCLESLLGIEGSAARTYFGSFSEMLKPNDGDASDFDLDGRNRRPPRDPVNAMLSFCYALLTKDFATTLANVGLDPLLGFYHQPRFGRPALALDLMEEFRPLVADSVVVSVVNNRVIGPGDFVRAAGSVALTPPARKRLISAYERRMDQLVSHPVFGYRISYRRVLEVQARLMSRFLLGEIARYPAFRTR